MEDLMNFLSTPEGCITTIAVTTTAAIAFMEISKRCNIEVGVKDAVNFVIHNAV